MKKRINKILVLITMIAIVLTAGLITMAYYNAFCTQVMSGLRDCSRLLRETTDSGEDLQALGENLSEKDIRMTLIDADGVVFYDSKVEVDGLENHLDRPEVKEAMEEGDGEAVRESATLSRNTFYYAVKISDGNVLRVSKDADSIFSIFGSVLPTIFWIMSALILLSMGLAHLLTNKLIEPVQKMANDIDKCEVSTEYEELAPFIGMIQKQHADILKNAMIRQEFTANVSHELKTPLTAISGYAELIETGMASEEDVGRFAHGIRSSSERLLVLINDIIRLSELDGDGQEAPFENLNLYELADTCVEMLQMNAEKHGVSISLSGYECHVHGNRQMVEELLYNLCDNAIRYNNEGGKVEVLVYRDKSAENRTALMVRDTGIGIHKEHQSRIFERFYRVDKSRSKSTGGTGLGLAIVKHIVAKHGAEITLQSEAGKGTKIKVLFPLPRQVPRAVSSEP